MKKSIFQFLFICISLSSCISFHTEEELKGLIPEKYDNKVSEREVIEMIRDYEFIITDLEGKVKYLYTAFEKPMIMFSTIKKHPHKNKYDTVSCFYRLNKDTSQSISKFSAFELGEEFSRDNFIYRRNTYPKDQLSQVSKYWIGKSTEISYDSAFHKVMGFKYESPFNYELKENAYLY